jgi:hypothetical protein
MKRVLALTAIVALVNASAAFAGEGLLASTARVARRMALQAAAAPAAQAGGAAVNAQETPSLAGSGMGRSRKILIAVAAAMGFAATAYTIDHHVEDNTPSSHGLRQD